MAVSWRRLRPTWTNGAGLRFQRCRRFRARESLRARVVSSVSLLLCLGWLLRVSPTALISAALAQSPPINGATGRIELGRRAGDRLDLVPIALQLERGAGR